MKKMKGGDEMKVAEKLGAIIKSKGIKLTAISSATGIRIKTLSDIFTGHRRLTADEFISICKFIGVSLEEVRDYESAA